MDLYFKPHPERKKEIDFFEDLKKELGDVNHINENYKLPDYLINFYLDIPNIIQNLKKENRLSTLKKGRLLAVLSDLPIKVKVAEKISNVTVDFVLKNQNEITFVEFHEKQHRNISVSRLVPIFTPDNRRIEIPRYSQRFLKDIWRLEFLPNYKIVWWDWYAKNGIKEFDFHNPNREYYINGKFSFTDNFG